MTISSHDPLAVLTRAQRLVFDLVAEGLTIREVAEAAGLSRKTVETHRYAIRDKLKLRNTAALVRLSIACEVQRAGLVNLAADIMRETRPRWPRSELRPLNAEEMAALQRYVEDRQAELKRLLPHKRLRRPA